MNDKTKQTLGDISLGAHQGWVENSIKNAEQRNVGYSKFLFAASAGTLGLIHFADMTKSDSLGGCVALLFISALIAVLIAEPPYSKLDSKMDVHKEFKSYSDHRRYLRYAWILCWLIGVFFFLTSIEALEFAYGGLRG